MRCVAYISVLLVLIKIDITHSRAGKQRNVSEKLYIPQIPKNCADIGFCEHVPNYPKEHVAEVIRKFKRRVRNQEVQTSELYTNSRLGGGMELELCEYRRREFVPQAAQGEDGKWYFVLNQGNFKQKFIAVECRTQGSCENVVSFRGDYHTGRCLQKNNTIYLYAMNHFGLEIEKKVTIPSCCSCVATRKWVIT